MKGDKIVVEKGHKRAGENLYPIIKPEVNPEEVYVITVAGESGSGKSEVATVLTQKFQKDGLNSLILQQDDYFKSPPKTNHEKRKKDISRVGPEEVRLDLINQHIKTLKKGESIEKPEMNFELDKEYTKTVEPVDLNILIIEGTYTTLLEPVDKKIFINKSYLDTKKFREKRARETEDPYLLENIVKREHAIINQHKELADIVLDKEYNLAHS